MGDDHLTPTLESLLVKGGMGNERETETEKERKEWGREGEGGTERGRERLREDYLVLSWNQGIWNVVPSKFLTYCGILGKRYIPSPICASVPSSMK